MVPFATEWAAAGGPEPTYLEHAELVQDQAELIEVKPGRPGRPTADAYLAAANAQATRVARCRELVEHPHDPPWRMAYARRFVPTAPCLRSYILRVLYSAPGQGSPCALVRHDFPRGLHG